MLERRRKNEKGKRKVWKPVGVEYSRHSQSARGDLSERTEK